MKKKIIAIVGLMGVGKTTLGSRLAEKIGYYFIDSDQEIEDKEGLSVSEIFSNFGEKYFREKEKEVIKEILSRDEEIVLSLGGGAFVNDEIREDLKNIAITIWLKAPLEVIIYRVSNKGNRPLLNQRDKKAVLEGLIEKRYPIYSQADFSFDTGSDNHENVVKKIIQKIGVKVDEES